MKARLAAFAVLVGLFGGLPHFLIDRAPRTIAASALAQLIPDKIGGYRVTERWKNALGEEVDEDSVYQDQAGNAPVLLDVKNWRAPRT